MTQELTKWVFDPAHGKIGLSVPHFDLAGTAGHFRQFDDTINAQTDDFPDTRVILQVNVCCVDTLDKQRDGHLLPADFFHKDWGMMWENILDVGGLTGGENVITIYQIKLLKK